MIFKNRYVTRAKLSEVQFRKIIKYFVAENSATEIAEKLSINRNTVNRYVNLIRERIAVFCEQNSGITLLIDNYESSKANIGDMVKTKLTVGLDYLKRRGKVYTESLEKINLRDIASKIQLTQNKGVVHSIDADEDLALVAIGYDNNVTTANTSYSSYVQDLERYWNFLKNRLIKFHGLAKHKYYLHVKESEFRFNLRNDDLYSVLLKMFKEQPLECAS
ncbi:MAG: hypothetical protein EKK64_06405 [Neisseriaceae bacterium]|nr:MAG: hypothetical protein EKK64_06405 [Neisseriaceae bacterium]